MDVTHIPEFGQLQFVHVIIDTFSHFLIATARTGEAVKDVVAHGLHAFSILGIPKCIKTDNTPDYTSKSFFSFCLHFGVNLKTGILYNPQGQGIVEHTHQTLKAQLLKQKGGIEYATPANRLNHTLFVLNF
jgi:transposase InsO family protein